MNLADTPASSPLVPGYRLDRYELLCPIAEGGMAEVWVARLQRKHGFEKLVAIKTILPKFAEDIRFQQMFLDEARIASRIEHANVAHIVDLGDEHDILYLVMEWVDGEALSKLNRACERKKLKIPYGILLRILADTCGGLHAAHELRGSDGELLGVVHRDVSPQNILLTTKGVAKLIDFGIAKARDRVAEDTNAGLLKGKIQYMAPEQALGKAVDRRADVWAIGAIAYTLITGHPPYEGENQLATLHLLTSGKPPIPLPPSVPQPVRDVVRRALAHDAEKRFATAAELQAALEQAMVDAQIVTTTSDVAAFAAEHVGDRAEARRRSIDLALKAAADRVRMHALLQPPSPDSSSGYLDASLVKTAALTSSGRISVAPPSGGPRSAPPSSGPPPALYPSVPPLLPMREGAAAMARPLSDSEASNATLGSAALEAPLSGTMVKKRGRIGLALALFGGGCALLAATALVALRTGAPSRGSAAAAASGRARTESTTAPPSSAPPPALSASAAAAAPSASVADTASSAAPAPSPSSTTAPPPRFVWGGHPANPTPTTGGAAAPATTAAAPAPPPKPGVIDDGF